MRKTVFRWFWIWDFEKEERWLNEMAAQGLNLVRVGWCTYEFEGGTPGEYRYRKELRGEGLRKAEDAQYLQFLRETGVEIVGHAFRWYYFRRKAAEGEFDLFSDLDSRIRHLQRIRRMLAMLLFAECCFMPNNINLYLRSQSDVALACVWIIAACILMLAYGVWRFQGMIRRLQREREIRE